MTVPQITAVRLGGSPRLPLLVLGPSLGTSARALWTSAAGHLAEHFEVMAWDLPGHGSNPIVGTSFTTAELAAGVLEMVDEMLANRGELHTSFFYAGAGAGSDVGLQLLLDAPHRVESAVLLPAAPDPDHCPPGVDATGFAQVRDATSVHDALDRLGDVGARVLVVGDASEPAAAEALAQGLRHGRLVTAVGTLDLSQPEPAAEVARLVTAHAAGEAVVASADLPVELRALLGGDQPDASPPLDGRGRSLVDLTALVITRQHDDLAAHVREALLHGLSRAEITAVVLQAARHVGLDGAQAAWVALAEVLDEIGPEPQA